MVKCPLFHLFDNVPYFPVFSRSIYLYFMEIKLACCFTWLPEHNYMQISVCFPCSYLGTRKNSYFDLDNWIHQLTAYKYKKSINQHLNLNRSKWHTNAHVKEGRGGWVGGFVWGLEGSQNKEFVKNPLCQPFPNSLEFSWSHKAFTHQVRLLS